MQGIANGFFGFDIASRCATIWDDGEKKFTLTNEKQLGEAVVSVLKHPEITANKYLYISSVETSQNEILAALEKATSSKWTLHREAFIATFGDAEIEARTDGYLDDHRGKPSVIVEVKPLMRSKKLSAIRMQESAQMVAWM